MKFTQQFLSCFIVKMCNGITLDISCCDLRFIQIGTPSQNDKHIINYYSSKLDCGKKDFEKD